MKSENRTKRISIRLSVVTARVLARAEKETKRTTTSLVEEAIQKNLIKYARKREMAVAA